jgi:CRP-like cAMP-binding protein
MVLLRQPPSFIMTPSSNRPTHLLSGLSCDLFSELFAAARPLRLAAGQTLFAAGDDGDGCYRVETGLLKVTLMSPSGSERILAVVGAGAVVGELSMIDAAPRSTSVCALRDSELGFVSRGDFDRFVDRRPDVLRHITRVMAQRLRDTNMALAAGSFLPVKGRVARSFLTLADAFGHDVGRGRVLIRQKVSQGDLAAMSGIARENVSRIVNDWKRDAVLSRLAAYYCLENRAVLERDAAL